MIAHVASSAAPCLRSGVLYLCPAALSFLRWLTPEVVVLTTARPAKLVGWGYQRGRWPIAHPTGFDATAAIAYHSDVPAVYKDRAMTEPSDKLGQPVNPLTVGPMRPLKEWAEEFPLSYSALRHYAKSGRLQAIKFGNQWATTRQAIEEYLASRDQQSIPKKYRNRT